MPQSRKKKKKEKTSLARVEEGWWCGRVWVSVSGEITGKERLKVRKIDKRWIWMIWIGTL